MPAWEKSQKITGAPIDHGGKNFGKNKSNFRGGGGLNCDGQFAEQA
jgi:hypothetical protein